MAESIATIIPIRPAPVGIDLHDDALVLGSVAAIVTAVADRHYPFDPDLAVAIDAALERVRRDLARAG